MNNGVDNRLNAPTMHSYPPQAHVAPGYPPPQNMSHLSNNDSVQFQPQFNSSDIQLVDQSSTQPPDYVAESKIDSSEKFKSKSGFNDVWAAILFLLHLAGFVVLAGLMLKDYKGKVLATGFKKTYSIEEIFTSTSFFTTVVSSTVLSGVLSLIYVYLMQIAARALIIISFWFTALLFIAYGVLHILSRSLFSGIVLIFIGALYVYFWFVWKHRIPLATLMLKNVSKFTRNYPGTIFVGLITTIVSVGYTILFIFTMIGVSQKYPLTCSNSTLKSKGSCSFPPLAYVAFIFASFSFYWTTNLINGINHMTIAGAFASDYFFPSTTSTASKFTSFASLGRALTTSFGSICFGSLLLSILNLLKSASRSASENADNIALAFLACCCTCILAYLEFLFEMFNTYAYTYCAMYGLPYIQAGKATWSLVKERGVDALVNDSLIGNVIGMGSLLISIICTAASYGILISQLPKADSLTIIIVLAISFLGALFVNRIVSQIIESANVAFFVCLAEDPQALKAYNPELFEKIDKAYPLVLRPQCV